MHLIHLSGAGWTRQRNLIDALLHLYAIKDIDSAKMV